MRIAKREEKRERSGNIDVEKIRKTEKRKENIRERAKKEDRRKRERSDAMEEKREREREKGGGERKYRR